MRQPHAIHNGADALHGIVGLPVRPVEEIPGMNMRSDDQRDLHRRRQQMMRQLEQAIGIAGKIIVDDHPAADPRGQGVSRPGQ
jgi:hypothetical protein